LVRRPLFGILYQPRMIHEECGAVGGMRIGRGSRSSRRIPAPVPLCPPQIPRDLNWDRTRGGNPATNRLSYGTAVRAGDKNRELQTRQPAAITVWAQGSALRYIPTGVGTYSYADWSRSLLTACFAGGGVQLLASLYISTRAP
jgi:hypothetical protein